LITAACGVPPGDSAETSSGEPVQVCASHVFVGRVGAGQTCADHGAWTGVALGDVGLMAELCEYTWQGDQPADLASLPGAAEGVFGLVESCPRVVPQADPFSADPKLRATIHNAFMTTVGKLSLAPFVPLVPRPWLTIVDTIPESVIAAGVRPNDRHGLDLRALAEGVLCDDPKHCPVSLTNTLGLPRVSPDAVDYVRGGAFGSPMDLARGVSAAVDAWETHGDGARLVLALAVGWEPLGEYGPDLAGKSLGELLAPGGAATDVQAVLAALTRAACQDAWIVAAVGNATSEPCAQSGAVGPAMLQALASPSAAQCEALGFPHAALTGAPTPFLLSAAHIGFDGQPLANARVDAPAGITAQGATFGSLDGEGGMITGSSVATIVGATTIAAVSAVYPKMSRADVLASVRPDAATGVNVCHALVRACGRPGAESCVVTTCPEEDGSVVKSVAAAIAAALNPPPCSPGDPGCVAPNAIQLGDKFPDSQALGDNDCGTPTTMWPSATLPQPLPPLPPPLPPFPWTQPTPIIHHCPTCINVLQSVPPKLTVGLSLPEAPIGPHPLFIEVQTATGVERYALDPAKLVAGVNTVTILPALAWGNVQQIRLVLPVQGMDGRWYMKSEPLLRSGTTCGDGVIDAGEACDGATGCAEDCTLTAGPLCGDGIVEEGEACDDGNMKAGDGCEEDCTVTPGPLCGNGQVDAGEACDDGNMEPGDGCEKNCTLTPEPVCGNGKVEFGEICDDGNTDGDDDCSADCSEVTAAAICGNGQVEGTEACDDGNPEANDGCEPNCEFTLFKCGNGKVEGVEACDDGNMVNGGPGDFCKNDCTAFMPADCEAPAAEDYIVCDKDLDKSGKADKTIAHKAIGICNENPANSVVISGFDFQSNNNVAWQVAKGFGTYTFDNDMDPNTPDKLLYSPREGDTFLMVSTGVIKAPNAKGIVVEDVTSQGSNGDNGNDDTKPLPAPFQSNRGSGNGLGNTPFQNCDGENDCSDTLQAQWELGNSDPYDKLWFTFKTLVPAGTFGYKFDFVFCSSEWPSQVNTEFNDLLIAWQTDPSLDDPNADPPVDPYTGNVTFIPNPNQDGPNKSLPLTITALDPYLKGPGFSGNEPQLAGTGFETHACSNWFNAKGGVQPGAEITIGFFIADMSDTLRATMAIIDNFRWDCGGCTPSEIDDCGVQLPQ